MLLHLYYLKGYALCRRLLLALRGCHLRGLCLHFSVPGHHLSTLGAPQRTILAPRDRPWERQDGHEVVRNRIFIDFEVILGHVYISLLSSRNWKCLFSSGHFLYRYLRGNVDAGSSQVKVFLQGKYCKHQLSTEVFFMNFGVESSRFLKAAFLLFWCLENKFKNRAILSDSTNLE